MHGCFWIPKNIYRIIFVASQYSDKIAFLAEIEPHMSEAAKRHHDDTAEHRFV